MVNPKETAWHLCDYLPTILDVCWVWEGNITTDTLLWAVNNYLLTLSAPAIWSLCQDKVGSFMMTIIFVSSWQWDGFIVISVHSNIIIVVIYPIMIASLSCILNTRPRQFPMKSSWNPYERSISSINVPWLRCVSRLIRVLLQNWLPAWMLNV